MMNVKLSRKSNVSEYFEVVERKGLGHPDTIADGIAEQVSLEYSRFCLREFGAILRHNTDKVYLRGGRCEIAFGRGELLNPISVYLGGRMSSHFGGRELPIVDLAVEAATNYVREILPALDLEQNLQSVFLTSQGSKIPYRFCPRGLNDLPAHGSCAANDSSVVVGHWPNTVLEGLVLSIEKYFYVSLSPLRRRYEHLGSDIKILATRHDACADIVICVPFLAANINSLTDYLSLKELLERELLQFIQETLGTKLDVRLSVNSQDRTIAAENDGSAYYLAVTGSALDYGEEGMSGRGNRSRGLISSCRISTVESPYGKNPVYHVGKVLAYAAQELAKKIGQTFEVDATVVITTMNGDPLMQPHSVDIFIPAGPSDGEVLRLLQSSMEDRMWTEEIVERCPFLPRNELSNES